MGYIMEGMTIHEILVCEENFQVQVEKVIILNASLSIPINEEIYLVGHVVRSFIAWLQSLALMDGDQQQPARKVAHKKGKRAGKWGSQPKSPHT